jgi:endonuclease IV
MFEISVGKREGPLLKVWNGENYLEYRFGLGKRAVDKFALFGSNFIPLSLLCKFLKEKNDSQAPANSETTTKEDKWDG